MALPGWDSELGVFLIIIIMRMVSRTGQGIAKASACFFSSPVTEQCGVNLSDLGFWAWKVITFMLSSTVLVPAVRQTRLRSA